MKLEKKVGIPKAMLYYTYFPFWYGFFNDLGIEVILSNNTTKKTISDGASLVVTETCLPVKVFVGHVLDLINKGVKNIFVPSIQSIAPKIYNCSKIRGLPDLIRNVVKGDFNLIEATLDKSEKDKNLIDFLLETASYFGINDFDVVKKAQRAGFVVQNNFNVMVQNGLDFDEALNPDMSLKDIMADLMSEKEEEIKVYDENVRKIEESKRQSDIELLESGFIKPRKMTHSAAVENKTIDNMRKKPTFDKRFLSIQNIVKDSNKK